MIGGSCRGPAGCPPEIGALCLDPDGPVTYNGVQGTFERLASVSAFIERYRRITEILR